MERPVPTEWLKVMLEEIARKRDEAVLAREELDRRRSAREPVSPRPGAAEPAPRPRA